MPAATAIKPAHKAIKSYYAALGAYARQDVEHESAVRSAFQNLLDEIGRHFGWTLIPELSETTGEKTFRPDGTFRDDDYITRGYWEWVVNQYQVSEDKRSGIRSAPNRPDDSEYIVRLVGQVVRVSVETMKIIDSLPTDFRG